MNRLATLFSIFGSCFLAVSVAVIFIAVICRYIFNFALSFPEELARYCFLWMTFFGAAAAEYHAKHLKVDVILNIIKGKKQKAVIVFSLFASMAFYFTAAYWGLEMTIFNYEMESVAIALDMSMVWVWAAIPLCMFMAGIFCACRLWKAIIS